MESCRPLKCQAWLITYGRSLKDLTGQTFPSKSPSCQFHLALWEKGILSLLVPDRTYLGLDGMISDGLHTCSTRKRGLELERDTWTDNINASLIGRVIVISASASAFKFSFLGTRLTTHLSSFFKRSSTMVR